MAANKQAGNGKALTTYEKWLESEDIEVIRDYMITDVRAVPLTYWPRKEGYGVHICLHGAEDCNAAYICEIPVKGALKPQKHLFEEMITILDGEGKTEIWNEGGPKVVCRWKAGSLFAVPLNAWHQHFNSGDRPARYLAVTDAPPVIDLFHNHDFIFNNPFVFEDRFNGEPDYFSSKGELMEKTEKERMWLSNFIPNVENFQLQEFEARAKGGKSIRFELSGNTMASHISEFAVGVYKKAHRHAPGAHILILDGKGYSLLWSEGQSPKRFDWQRGSFIVPGRMWFHQHFNTGDKPARYLALRWGSQKYLTGKHFSEGEDWWFSTKSGGNQIEYEDEDPKIREMYVQELSKNNLELKMPPVGK